MKKRLKLYLSILKEPRVFIFFTCILFILINLVLAHHLRPYNSDDVSWQNALLNWRPFQGNTLYYTPDTWILKLPFYLVFGHLFEPGRKVLFVESALFAVMNFTFFYFAALYFLKKMGVVIKKYTLLPFVWLASFGYDFTRLFLNPNLRNFEIGLSFVFLVFIAKIYYKEIRITRSARTIILGLLASFLTACMVYNDPYFLYFTLLPSLLLLGYFYIHERTSRKTIYILGLGLVVSAVFLKIISMIGAAADFHVISQAVVFVEFDKFFTQVNIGLQSLLVLFGADFFGREAINLVTFGKLLNFGLLLFVSYLLFSDVLRDGLVAYKKDRQDRVWRTFFILNIVLVILIYLFSNMAGELNTYRYLVILPFLGLLALIPIIQGLNRNTKLLLSGLFLVSAVFNLSSSFAASKYPVTVLPNHANAQDFQVVNKIKEAGLTKGYTQYWASDINTYFSKGTVQFLPVLCGNVHANQVAPFYWLVDGSLFTQKSERTFYMFDPDQPNTGQCTEAQIKAQFGEPSSIFTVSSKTVYVYDYDLSSRMDLSKYPQ